MIGRALKGIKRPAPRVPVKPATSIKGRGGISMPAINTSPNKTILPSKPTPSIPTPVNPGLVSKNDPFFKSKEYKSFQKEQRGRPATMDMYNSPYFGSVSSGSVGRAQDEAYRKFKNIPDPTPPRIDPSRIDPRLGTQPPAGGVGKPGFKSGSGGFASNLFGTGAGMGSAPGNMTGMGPAGARASFGMKKGGVVKSSASKRADGIAQRGKTKGRMV